MERDLVETDDDVNLAQQNTPTPEELWSYRRYLVMQD